ncbi:MAG: methyltransferase domain-containing protein [Ardenticatenaceae bacterium]|nr:methyltransferase domain-containing protein [Ardenticatenaceae bacterium]
MERATSSFLTRLSTTTLDSLQNSFQENIRTIFGETADRYYAQWGEFFHLALFKEGDNPTNFETAFERTHERYFELIKGREARRIIELASGGGAFSEWMADRSASEVIGIDISDAQQRLAKRPRSNLRFIEWDIMQIADLDEAPFDASIYLDAACYVPSLPSAVHDPFGFDASIYPDAASTSRTSTWRSVQTARCAPCSSRIARSGGQRLDPAI